MGLSECGTEPRSPLICGISRLGVGELRRLIVNESEDFAAGRLFLSFNANLWDSKLAAICDFITDLAPLTNTK